MPSPAPARSSSFAADVLKLVTGTTIAQVITILAAPAITRLYGPEAFGFLAIFASITSILGVIACMRYELAIMLPKTDEEAANLRASASSVWRCPPLPPKGARAWFIPRLGFAVCLRRRGVSCVELPELAWQPFRVTEVTRVTSSPAITGTQLEVENA